MEEENETIWISKEEEGLRLDCVLAARFQEVQSRTYFQSLIRDGRVLLNGRPVKKRIQPKEGDEVEVFFVYTKEILVEPEAIPLTILYEDESILVVNKPVSMVVHPAPGHWTGTFVNALVYHCQHLVEESFASSFPRPGIVHRLDKDTSGVLIAAKNAKAQQKLIELFSERKVYKEYLAICLGDPGDRTITTQIGRHPIKRKEMSVVSSGGKMAVTHCKTIAFDGKLSVVQVVLETGRTHQIRVHMKHVGTPLIGDSVYGRKQANEQLKVKRQMLHAHRLHLSHPITGKVLEFFAAPPDDFARRVELVLKQGKKC